MRKTTIGLAAALTAFAAANARAEVSEITVAQQYGVSFLPLMLMQKDGLVISDKDYAFTLEPHKVFATAQFMAKIGSIKQAPASIGDLFFPEGAGKGD